MTNSNRTTFGTDPQKAPQAYDAELEPYVSLFMKPLTRSKSRFTKHELEVMCKDPRHSPQLIRYLIDVITRM